VEYSHALLESLRGAAAFLVPWEFSLTAFFSCAGALALYSRGLLQTRRQETPPRGRRIAFVSGVLFIYFVMQTRFDYLAQHMFYIHRLQHLVLHHLGPFLIALSAPLATLAAGAGSRFGTGALRRFWNLAPTQFIYRGLQNVLVAPLLFVGLIGFWLASSVHFDAMLSARLYWLMNWSMLIDGLLFWILVLDPRTRREGALLGFGIRILIVLVAMVPQILIGARIALSERDLYDVYAVCGRAWGIDPLLDQHLGGLITWIPASMMHVVAAIILIGRWARADKDGPQRVLGSLTMPTGKS